MLPKRENVITENENTEAEFLQEIVEPEVHVPEEPELLTEKKRVIIKPRRNSDA